MKLTPEQTQIVLKKLDIFFNSQCDCCKTREWLLNDKIFEMREFSNFPFPSPIINTVFPVVIATCKKCGDAHFFSAVLLGLLEKTP